MKQKVVECQEAPLRKELVSKLGSRRSENERRGRDEEARIAKSIKSKPKKQLNEQGQTGLVVIKQNGPLVETPSDGSSHMFR